MVLQRVLQIRNLTAQAKVTPPVATTTSTTRNATTTITTTTTTIRWKTKGTRNIPNILKISEGMNMQDTCIVFCSLKKTIHSCATRHQQTYAQLFFSSSWITMRLGNKTSLSWLVALEWRLHIMNCWRCKCGNTHHCNGRSSSSRSSSSSMKSRCDIKNMWPALKSHIWFQFILNHYEIETMSSVSVPASCAITIRTCIPSIPVETDLMLFWISMDRNRFTSKHARDGEWRSLNALQMTNLARQDRCQARIFHSWRLGNVFQEEFPSQM